MATYEQLMDAARRADSQGNESDARRLLELASQARNANPAQPQNSISGIAGQVGAGSNEGIAQALGFPVEAVADAIGGLGQLTGMWGRPENPIGGQQFFNDLLAPFSSGVAEPQTDAERFARRVGEEIGGGATMAPLGLATAAGRAAPAAAALVEGASSLGAGIGAATAQHFAPDSGFAEIAGLLAGGIPAGAIAARQLGMNGTDAVTDLGTIEAQRQRAADAYGMVRADQAPIGPQAATDLELGLIDAAIRADIDPNLSPNSYRVEQAISDRINPNMTVEDVEKLRRIAGRAIPVTASGEDIAGGMALKNQITDYLESINSPTTEALQTGRDATRRYKAAEALMEAQGKAVRRAASTGSGGNEINAMRQNLRSILDSPSKRRAFTKTELEQIERIVTGTTPQNAMRKLSRFAPSGSGLIQSLNLAGMATMPTVAAPVMAITEGAKVLGERSTRGSIDDLVRSLLGERIVQTGTDSYSPVARALLGARAFSEDNR